MENTQYSFRLTEDEVLEYYRYNFSAAPQNKKRRYWLMISIPGLLLVSLLFFQWYHSVWIDVAAGVFAVFWIVFLSGRVFHRFITRTINHNFLQRLNVKDYPVVHVKVGDQKISVDDKTIDYASIRDLVPLSRSLVVKYDDNKAFIIPLRVIGDTEQVQQFCQDILRRRAGAVNGAAAAADH